MPRESYTGNWFSNMLEFDRHLRHQGIAYPTPEHFYQAMKTQRHDTETRRRIAAATPYEAKRLGRRVRLRADWPGIHLAVMETALRYKFAPGTSWHERLMATGDDEIVEWNNWGDRYWGRDLRDGRGENHLGRLLMKLRDEWRGAGSGVSKPSTSSPSRRRDRDAVLRAGHRLGEQKTRG